MAPKDVPAKVAEMLNKSQYETAKATIDNLKPSEREIEMRKESLKREKQKADENDADAIARFGQANNPRSYKLVKTNDDHIRGIFNWKLHGAENAAANNQIRQQFIFNVLKCLGWDPAQSGIREDQVLTQAQIEEAVNEILPGRGNEARRNDLLKDMKVWDYGKGRPLTSRRISATINRVKAIVVSHAPQGDFVVEGKRQFLTGDTAEILAALSPDMFVDTPTGDDEPANVGGNGNPPPSDSDPVEFENPSAGFKAGKLSEEFVFQGDKDVVRRGVKTEVGEKKEASHLLD